ncbi:MAG: zinc finger domain-containing protein, partial [Peptococcus niger]
EITKALEEARQNKTIGNSLDAKVVFALTGETVVYRQDVAALGDDLADFLLVSQAEMVEALNGDVWTSDLLPGLTLQVLPAEGEKCPRCWKYSTTVGHHHPDLCDRCADVLTNEEA